MCVYVCVFVYVAQTSVDLRAKCWSVWSLFPNMENLSPLQTMTTYEDISLRYKYRYKGTRYKCAKASICDVMEMHQCPQHR